MMGQLAHVEWVWWQGSSRGGWVMRQRDAGIETWKYTEHIGWKHKKNVMAQSSSCLIIKEGFFDLFAAS